MFQSCILKELRLPVKLEMRTSIQRVQDGLKAMVTLVLPPTVVPTGISTGFVPFTGHTYSCGDPMAALAVEKNENNSAATK